MNLVPFALFSQKIPGEFLLPQNKKSNTARNITSLIIDYAVVSIFTSIITLMMSTLINMYLGMVSTKFVMNYPQLMNFIVFPLALFAYYTICLHAGDGLTLGSKMTRQRITEGNSLKQALHFTLTATTFGATYFLVKNSFEKIDYRYQNLVMIRDEKVDLHALITENEHEDQPEFSMAA